MIKLCRGGYRSFMKIGPPVLEKIVERYLTYIYVCGGHLDHVTKISRTIFQCHYFQLDRPSGVREEEL